MTIGGAIIDAALVSMLHIDREKISIVAVLNLLFFPGSVEITILFRLVNRSWCLQCNSYIL